MKKTICTILLFIIFKTISFSQSLNLGTSISCSRDYFFEIENLNVSLYDKSFNYGMGVFVKQIFKNENAILINPYLKLQISKPQTYYDFIERDTVTKRFTHCSLKIPIIYQKYLSNCISINIGLTNNINTFDFENDKLHINLYSISLLTGISYYPTDKLSVNFNIEAELFPNRKIERGLFTYTRVYNTNYYLNVSYSIFSI